MEVGATWKPSTSRLSGSTHVVKEPFCGGPRDPPSLFGGGRLGEAGSHLPESAAASPIRRVDCPIGRYVRILQSNVGLVNRQEENRAEPSLLMFFCRRHHPTTHRDRSIASQRNRGPVFINNLNLREIPFTQADRSHLSVATKKIRPEMVQTTKGLEGADSELWLTTHGTQRLLKHSI